MAVGCFDQEQEAAARTKGVPGTILAENNRDYFLPKNPITGAHRGLLLLVEAAHCFGTPTRVKAVGGGHIIQGFGFTGGL